MFNILILLNVVSNSNSQCSNKLFLEHTVVNRYGNNDKIPSLKWKDKMVYNKVANISYDTLDYDNYELMIHARNYDSTIIYRVCPKYGTYEKYNNIIRKPLHGYLIEYNNLDKVNYFLNNYNFNIYGPKYFKQRINIYKDNIYNEKVNNLRKNSPIFTFIVIDLFELIFKMIKISITAILFIIIFYSLSIVLVNILISFYRSIH